MSDPAPLAFRPDYTICLLGSPRRLGNSDVLAERFCARASLHGATFEQVVLAELEMNGCRNLFRCKSDLTRCGQEDAFTPVLEQLAEAEVLVLASPVYFTNISGQLKLAIDRLFSFLVPNYAIKAQKSRLCSQRTLVFIQTQGEADDRYQDLMDSYSAGFAHIGFDRQYLIRAHSVREPGDLDKHPEFLEHCDAVADRVYGG